MKCGALPLPEYDYSFDGPLDSAALSETMRRLSLTALNELEAAIASQQRNAAPSDAIMEILAAVAPLDLDWSNWMSSGR